MAPVKIAAITRAGAYSPNHIGFDANILSNVAEQLRKRGCVVTVYTEEMLADGKVTEQVIINMCREKRSLAKLTELENEGVIVVNSPAGILNCMRERQTRILMGGNLPIAESVITSTDLVIKEELQRRGFDKCWVKRADNYAMHKEDLSYVRTPVEAQEVLQEYFLRGIKRAVISRHIKGDIIKFYGVEGSDFFYWYFPFDPQLINHGDKDALNRTETVLKNICSLAAAELNVIVYGGDAVLDGDGNITLIDFNDWPSFAPCRDIAAPAIAKRVLAMCKPRRVTRSKNLSVK